ncbi:MAG: hypothetical protein RML40_05595 [Bacteroidota bacterium]|nr:hypothetical protein [Candidatus Kapabacteria bacterium]MDW8219987.1 hypothetical protein [Bacteroidota bacterium]
MPTRRILFAAHDPGGANVIKPVIEHIADRNDIEMHTILLGPAAERLQCIASRAISHTVRSFPTPHFPNELSAEPQDVAAVFDAVQPSAVFTATSFNSNLERLTVRYARERAIPTFAILDFWSRYAHRFTLDDCCVPPDILFVTDERMQREATAELPTTTIIVSGNPHLAQLQEHYANARRHLYDSPSPHPPLQRIRFFCENIRHYYPDKPVNEFTIIPKLLDKLLHYGFTGELIIRPHPMESRAPWENALVEYNTKTAGRIAILLDTASFHNILQERCIALGLTSMALLETVSVGIPTFSYQIAVPSEYFWLPFEEYGIPRILRDEDILQIVSCTFQKPQATQHSAPSNALLMIQQVLEEHLFSPIRSAL